MSNDTLRAAALAEEFCAEQIPFYRRGCPNPLNAIDDNGLHPGFGNCIARAAVALVIFGELVPRNANLIQAFYSISRLQRREPILNHARAVSVDENNQAVIVDSRYNGLGALVGVCWHKVVDGFGTDLGFRIKKRPGILRGTGVELLEPGVFADRYIGADWDTVRQAVLEQAGIYIIKG